MVILERKIKKIGNSLSIILGSEFCDIHNIKEGEVISLKFMKSERDKNARNNSNQSN